MKSKLFILILVAAVLVSFSFVGSKSTDQSGKQNVTKSGKNMVDKDQFN